MTETSPAAPVAARSPVVETLAILGLGHIGSSFAQAVRRAGAVRRIVGSPLDAAECEGIVAAGIADRMSTDPIEVVADADVVMLAAPLSAYDPICRAIGPHLKPGAIVSDVGSVKRPTLQTLQPLIPAGVHLVPGHPVAGTENSGYRAGFAELFLDRWVILTPPPSADPKAVDVIADLWRAAGSKVEFMDAGHHDRVLAVTSHLPHLIAYTIVGTASDLEASERAEVIKFSASGFRDFTRIAASDPVMWRDVFLSNKDAVLEILQRFTEDLTALQRAIRWGDGDQLHELFTRTRDIRRSVVSADPVVRRSSDGSRDDKG